MSLGTENGRVLFLYENDARFVRDDLYVLRSRYDVRAVDCSGGTSLRGLAPFVREAQFTFSWFALGYAARAVLLGKLLGTPSVVVAGGWDVVSMPEIGYGAVRNARGRARARLTLRYADRVLAFSKWSAKGIRDLTGREAEVVFLGVDVERFRPAAEKENLVVTVGNVSRENLERKGLRTFVRAAWHLPDVRFVLVGRHVDDAVEELRQDASPNVEFPGYVSDEQLTDILGRSRVYVQVSYNEGFGLSLAEAMAAGCVPVATRAGAIPEVVGEVGFYVPFGDSQATALAVSDAVASGREGAARTRIAENFPLDRRRRALLRIIEEV